MKTGYNKVFEESAELQMLIWNYSKSGIPASQILSSLKTLYPNFKCTEPTLNEYLRIRKSQEDDDPDSIPTAITIDPRTAVKNDGLVLDMVIQMCLDRLNTNSLDITVPMALKAMDMKRNLMGDDYKGDTIWALMDYQKKFNQLVEVMAKRCPTSVYNEIIEDLRALGWVQLGNGQISDPIKHTKILEDFLTKDLADLDTDNDLLDEEERYSPS